MNLPPTPPTILSLSVDSRVLGGAPRVYSSSPLASYFTHGGVYMSTLLSQFVPPNPDPASFLLLLQQSPSLLLFFQIRTKVFLLNLPKTGLLNYLKIVFLVRIPKTINKGREWQQKGSPVQQADMCGRGTVTGILQRYITSRS